MFVGTWWSLMPPIIAILLALVVDALFIFFVTGLNPAVRLWRHVERHLRQHDPLQLDAARPVHAALRRHRAGPGLQDALLELRRRGPDPDRRPDCRPHHGVSGQQSAAAAAVRRHGAGQHCRGRTVGFHPRVVQVPLEHERDAVHPDDELRCYVHCCLHDQHHARPGVEPRHAEQGDQGRLVPRHYGPALHHQHHCGHRADLRHVRLSALLQAGL